MRCFERMRPKERVVHERWQPPWIRNEHLARYRFATELVRGRVVVDCACGDGTGTRVLSEGGAERVYAFDRSPEAVSMARSTASCTHAEVQLADALSLPLPKASVDVYVSFETIEHVRDPEAFLDEVVRVLRDNGTFVCSTPNRAIYSPGHSAESKPWNPFHVCEFSLTEFATLLSSRFAKQSLYAQNDRGRFRAVSLRVAGRILPWNLAVRLRQIAKLPLLVFDREDRHGVRSMDVRRPPEILVAVCATPLSASNSRA